MGKAPKTTKNRKQAVVASSETEVKPVRRKARVERLLKKRAPQLVENTKNALIFRGNHTSQDVCNILKDFSMMCKPNCRALSRNNDIRPFEDSTSLEFLAQKNDCSLFIMGSHSKKRPNNIVMGRLHDGHLLDAVEFGVNAFNCVADLSKAFAKSVGSKPMFVFIGDQWDTDASFGRIQNLFIGTAAPLLIVVFSLNYV